MDSFSNGPLVFPVLDEGSGPPVVLLHGFPQNARSWGAVAPQLNQAGLRTLRPTQRGCAATARPRSTGDYRVPHLASDVVALLDAARARAGPRRRARLGRGRRVGAGCTSMPAASGRS